MSGDDQLTPPPVVWAQQSKNIMLTICLEDCKKPTIDIQKDKIYFKGVGGTDKKAHEVTINLYKEINPEESLHTIRGRNIEFVLKKKEAGPFWPHLTKEKVKYHWLKFDFNKWNDEDGGDDDEDGSIVDVENVLKSMGRLDAGNDSELKQDYNDMYNQDDSDDSDLPDLTYD